MPCYAFDGHHPRIDPSAWIAPSADIIGRVTIGPDCYVGWGAILRADHGTIEIGRGAAVEEGVIIHTQAGFTSRFGEMSTLGHGAMFHSATVEEYAVVGMKATVSNRAVVGRWSIIGEAGLVKGGQIIPPESIAVGHPVRVIGPLEERHRDRWLKSKQNYVNFARRNKLVLQLVETPPQ